MIEENAAIMAKGRNVPSRTFNTALRENAWFDVKLVE